MFVSIFNVIFVLTRSQEKITVYKKVAFNKNKIFLQTCLWPIQRQCRRQQRCLGKQRILKDPPRSTHLSFQSGGRHGGCRCSGRRFVVRLAFASPGSVVATSGSARNQSCVETERDSNLGTSKLKSLRSLISLHHRPSTFPTSTSFMFAQKQHKHLFSSQPTDWRRNEERS